MEILGIVAVIVLAIVVRIAITAGARTTVAAAKTVFGKETFRENMNQQFHGMGQFRIRLSFHPKSEDRPFDHYTVECRGLIPVSRPRNVAMSISAIDITGPGTKPVLCAVDDFQEAHTIAFQQVSRGPKLHPNQGFGEWVELGTVIPEILVPPKRGPRRLAVIARVIDRDMTPAINLGFGQDGDPAVIAVASTEVELDLDARGYEEAAEQADRARPLAVRLAVAMAMADGQMDEAEGEVIRDWIIKQLTPLAKNHADKVKESCNEALRQAYSQGLAGELSLSDSVRELSEIEDEAIKYNTVELCLDVLAADGAADPEELLLIKRLSESLEIDYEELQKMKDKRLVTLDVSASRNATPAEILGIEEDWTMEQVHRHLRAEFAKWNGRLNHLEDPDERENAQKMLDLIAEVRKSHAT